jgi:hypothetical protein
LATTRASSSRSARPPSKTPVSTRTIWTETGQA